MRLAIEKLVYGGDGLARLPAGAVEGETTSRPDGEHARGKAVFIPLVLAGEKIDAAITEEKPGFARGRATAVLEGSPHRVEPACPYFGRCGGCHYQHASYEHQFEIKKEILRENLRRIAKLELQSEIEVHPSPPWNYRNRSRLQVQTAPQFAVGYFKLASHELMPVEECPVSSPLINRGLAALWRIGRAENSSAKLAAGIREIEFFANGDDTQLLVELTCRAEARRAEVRQFAEELTTALREIAGVVAFRRPEASVTAEAAAEVPLLVLGERFLTYRTQLGSYRVSAGSFFQTNRHLTDELVKIVTQGREGEVALDLYAGVGLFSTALAGDFRHIVSVESSQLSTGDLEYNLPSNAKAIQAATGRYLNLSGNDLPGRRNQPTAPPAKGVLGTTTLPTPDLVIVDPPRSGLGEPVARKLGTLGAPRVTYVSCDPATLARDLIPLLAASYRVEQVHLVDMFPQTYHLESVVQLVR